MQQDSMKDSVKVLLPIVDMKVVHLNLISIEAVLTSSKWFQQILLDLASSQSIKNFKLIPDGGKVFLSICRDLDFP